MAGLLRYSFDDATGRGRLLHTGPDSAKRERGTVWLSQDDGATWPVKRVLWPGGFAYSVPARLADGTVGVLFEADDYERSSSRASPSSGCWKKRAAIPLVVTPLPPQGIRPPARQLPRRVRANDDRSGSTRQPHLYNTVEQRPEWLVSQS